MKLKMIAERWEKSPDWDNLAYNSKRLYRYGMTFLEAMLERDADAIKREDVINLRDDLYKKPGACRMAIVTLNNILRYGHDRGMCKANVASNIRNMPEMVSIPRWTDLECRTFFHAAPRHLRMAFCLGLYTGQRIGDLIRMRWDQYDGKFITLKQQKTGARLKVPVHPHLKSMLDEEQKRLPLIRHKGKVVPAVYILLNSQEEPWSANSLQVAIKTMCNRLQIERRSMHGLRKTAAAKLAEMRCSPHLIASITGHKSLKEIMHYTEEADQERMATEAMETWANDTSNMHLLHHSGSAVRLEGDGPLQ